MEELVQERIDEKPWYKKILVLSEKIVLALSVFTMVYALVSIALSVGMNMGKIAKDTGILKQIRTWEPGISALIKEKSKCQSGRNKSKQEMRITEKKRKN